MTLKKLLRAGCAAAAIVFSAASPAALVGLTPAEPTIDMAAGGVISYKAADGTVTISGLPSLLLRSDPFLFGEFVGASTDDEKLVTIQFRVNASGQLIGGVDGPDLVIKGGIDVNFDGIVDYDGVLLTAEVSQFGFLDGAGGTTDRFDIRFTAVGGAMAPLFAGRDLAAVVDSEPSADYPNPFVGGFTTDFVGPAKAQLGTADPLVVGACKIDVEAYCSVDGGPNRSVCRIKVTKSPKHWEHVTHYYRGQMYRLYKYGMHGDPVPSWASRYPATDVKFTYVVTNTGTTPISALQVVDSFDIAIPGVPSVLQPGQSVTLMRTEALRDRMDDVVIVTGESGSASCADKDTVVVKDKVRHKRHHDYDDFKDKDHVEGRHN